MDEGLGEVGGHRGLLSVVSEVFAGMFGSGMEESRTGRVRVRGVSRESFLAFLEFVYVGRCGERVGAADGRELWVLAEAYQVWGLKEWLVKEGVWSMDSACQAMQYAKSAEGSFEGLAGACLGRASWGLGEGSEEEGQGSRGGGWAAAGAAWAWEQGHGGGRGAEGSREGQRGAEGKTCLVPPAATAAAAAAGDRFGPLEGLTSLDASLTRVSTVLPVMTATPLSRGSAGAAAAGQGGRSSSRSGGRVVERADARRRRGLMGGHRSSTAQHKASQNTACAAAALAGRHQHLRHCAP